MLSGVDVNSLKLSFSSREKILQEAVDFCIKHVLIAPRRLLLVLISTSHRIVNRCCSGSPLSGGIYVSGPLNLNSFTRLRSLSIVLTDIAAGAVEVSQADDGIHKSVVQRSRGDPARRTRRDASSADTVDRRDVDMSSIGQQNKVGLGEMLDEDRDLEMRDLDDLGRRSGVRDVDYDYIFGNEVNDDDDELVSSSSSSSSSSPSSHL